MKKEKVGNITVSESKLKKIGSFVLTASLIVSLSIPAKGDTICNPGKVEYYQRLYEYSQEKTYDEKLIEIYNNGIINIDGEEYPLRKFYITINTKVDGYDLHLMNIKSDYSDILTNSLDSYDYDRIVKFRDTTAFIELINSDCVLTDYERNIITIIDKEKALEIVKNWDGMIHNKVAETDAVFNKQIVKR